jgi:hypothetical protein
MSWVSANFGHLSELEQGMARTGASVDSEHGVWASQVNSLAEAWPDVVGEQSTLLSNESMKFDQINNDLLALVRTRIAEINANGQATQAKARGLIPEV